MTEPVSRQRQDNVATQLSESANVTWPLANEAWLAAGLEWGSKRYFDFAQLLNEGRWADAARYLIEQARLQPSITHTDGAIVAKCQKQTMAYWDDPTIPTPIIECAAKTEAGALLKLAVIAAMLY